MFPRHDEPQAGAEGIQAKQAGIPAGPRPVAKVTGKAGHSPLYGILARLDSRPSVQMLDETSVYPYYALGPIVWPARARGIQHAADP